jgi:hypothetical protein
MFVMRRDFIKADEYANLDAYRAYVTEHPSCDRDVSLLMLSAERDDLLQTLSRTIELIKRLPADEACAFRARALACEIGLWLSARAGRALTKPLAEQRCRPYLLAGGDLRDVMLVASAVAWPRKWAGPDVYLDVAELAAEAVPDSDAFTIALAAVAIYGPSAQCTVAELGRLHALARRLAAWSTKVDRRADVTSTFATIAHKCNKSAL